MAPRVRTLATGECSGFVPVNDPTRERAFWRSISRTRPRDIPTPGPGQESVWDYPRPPRVEASASRVRVAFGGQKIADTNAALRVLETAGPPAYYLPLADVHRPFLRPARDESQSLCEWKGVAHYCDLRVGPRRFARVAWYYAAPDPAYRALQDHIAFFAGRGGQAWVGDELVRPQPGEFYGGWITCAVVGPFKGEPGSELW